MNTRPSTILTRRTWLGGVASLAAVAAAGCTSTARVPLTEAVVVPPQPPAFADDILAMYRAMLEERFPIPAADIEGLDPRYIRTVVEYPTEERPGTVIVDTAQRYLYHVLPSGVATRYGAASGGPDSHGLAALT